MTNIWKVVPEKLHHHGFGILPIIKIEALPPYSHDHSPIINSLTCVVCHMSNDIKRYFGTKEAVIGPDLRMHILINPNNEMLRTWEDSDFFGDHKETRKVTNFSDLDDFTVGYITCALWSSTNDLYDENSEKYSECLDDQYTREDINYETIKEMVMDCKNFQDNNVDLLKQYYEEFEYEYAGHDFWLTRNGHEVGFWDRGLGEVGEKLTEACKLYGSVSLCVAEVGDHEEIFQM